MREERGPASWNDYLIIEYRAVLKESIYFAFIELMLLYLSTMSTSKMFHISSTLCGKQFASNRLGFLPRASLGWQKIMAGMGGQHCRCSTYRDLQPLFPLSILVDTLTSHALSSRQRPSTS
jgi:hypothetical protein